MCHMLYYGYLLDKEHYLCQGPEVLVVLAQVSVSLEYGAGVKAKVILGLESYAWAFS